MLKKIITLVKKIDNKINTSSESLFIYSEFLLRIFLGIAFIIHGYNKFPLPPATLIKYFGFSSHLASFVAISEVLAGTLIIFSGFINSFIGNLLTRISAIMIVVIMIFAFYFAHKDWFFNQKLFISEQIFLFVLGVYFLINGNCNFRK
tara:strand:- start:328 stop:771 length:444 start_codon:yes stop_codon:yes gene_type:complete